MLIKLLEFCQEVIILKCKNFLAHPSVPLCSAGRGDGSAVLQMAVWHLVIFLCPSARPVGAGGGGHIMPTTLILSPLQIFRPSYGSAS